MRQGHLGLIMTVCRCCTASGSDTVNTISRSHKKFEESLLWRHNATGQYCESQPTQILMVILKLGALLKYCAFLIIDVSQRSILLATYRTVCSYIEFDQFWAQKSHLSAPVTSRNGNTAVHPRGDPWHFWCGSGSGPLTNGSGCNSGSDSFLH